MNYQAHETVAPHIRMSQVACRCSDPTCPGKTFDPRIRPRTQLMLDVAGELITQYDLRVSVSSGLRCPAHNAAVGGAPDSAHVHYCAIDLRPDGPWEDLALLAEKQGFWSAIIVYPDSPHPFVHLDVHPSDRVTRGFVLGGKYHTTPWGRREGSPLDPIYAWNMDEKRHKKPRYVMQAEEREVAD